MGHGHHLRVYTVYAMFLARLPELPHRTARFLGLEGKLGRDAVSRSGPRAATAALCSSVHGVAPLARAGASDSCCLQMMMISFFLFANDTLRYPEILINYSSRYIYRPENRTGEDEVLFIDMG
jgi:hypothetical protein